VADCLERFSLFLPITPILVIAGIAAILFIPAVAWVLLVPIPVLVFSAVLANYPRHAYQTRRPWSPPHAVVAAAVSRD
jgi:hypothetical protein